MNSIDEEKRTLRGWWFSVVYMVLVMGLIWFLARVEIVEKNRDVLIGILGMITGSISSMLAIASGRDPAEVDELKDQLANQEADRAALIARLRDAQIGLQLKNDQLMELQTEMIRQLAGLNVTIKREGGGELNPHVAQWLPNTEQENSDDT